VNWLEVRATFASWLGRIACMRTLEAVNMSSTRSTVVHMSKMIQIRNVPDDLHRELKMQAAAAGMSMSDYIKRELSRKSRKSTIKEIGARSRARRAESTLTTQDIVNIIRETRGD
jgi:plasmid stability protein